ncbi:hypothetical protein [Georgenia sp. MJ170]|uniref:hypothetical protein n=1 Tax=Georgenia sunbinii TaxID=3117728 RepID=UPI002F266A4F
MSAPPDRRSPRLTAPQILLIAVVSVLVLLLVVMLVQRATSGGSPAADATTPSAVVTTAPDDDASADDVAPPDDDGATPSKDETPDDKPTYFASPSGNIACSITVDSADCVIAAFTYEPEDAQQCDDDAAGGHLRVEPAGASMPCDPLVVAGDVPALAYGETITAHGFTCESEESGVSCRHDESGSGFDVARADYELR